MATTSTTTMTTTMTSPRSKLKFPLTRLAVGGVTVAGFLGLWSAIAITAASGGAGLDSSVEPGQTTVIERQVVYVVGDAGAPSGAAGTLSQLFSPTAGSLPSSIGPASSVVRPVQAASAPPTKVKSSKKSKGS